MHQYQHQYSTPTRLSDSDSDSEKHRYSIFVRDPHRCPALSALVLSPLTGGTTVSASRRSFTTLLRTSPVRAKV